MKVFVLTLALFAAASAIPFNPWAAGFAYAGPRTGAAFGAGFWSPFGAFPFYEWEPVRIPVAWPTFSEPPVPWYKGPNVCENVTVAEEPDAMKEWFTYDDTGFAYGSIETRQESCRGNSKKYVCMRREMTDDGMKMVFTKYECCLGFVRSNDGSPGCNKETSEAQIPSEQTTSKATPPSKEFKMSDRMMYSFYPPNNKGSNSNSKSAVDYMPAQ